MKRGQAEKTVSERGGSGLMTFGRQHGPEVQRLGCSPRLHSSSKYGSMTVAFADEPGARDCTSMSASWRSSMCRVGLPLRV